MRDPKVNTIIWHFGTRGHERLEMLKVYPDGWDSGRGKKLSPESLEAFEKFIDEIFVFATQPSIFLTREGNIQIMWEDKERFKNADHSQAEIEFFSNDKLEFCSLGPDEECELTYDRMEPLIGLLLNKGYLTRMTNEQQCRA